MTRLTIGDNFPREFPGDTWNRLVDLLERVEQLGGPDQLLQLVNQTAVADPVGMIINVVNKTGSDLVENAIAIVKKNTFVFDPPGGEIDEADAVVMGGVQLEVESVNSSNKTEPFVITIDPIPDDATGRAYLPGASWARLDIQSEGDSTAGPEDGDAKCLKTGQGSTPILVKPPGTGIKWGIVQLGGGGGGGPTVRFAQIDVEVGDGVGPMTFQDPAYKPGSGRALLLVPSEDEAGAWVASDPEEFVTVKNIAGTKIFDGRLVLIEEVDGEWFVITEACF